MIAEPSDALPSGRYGRFLIGPIDVLPDLLSRSYRLRYQVYCEERKFLSPDKYPRGLECDDFDRHSIHVGAFDRRGELVGTARVIKPSDLGFPLFRYCRIFPDETEFHADNPRLVEVGRLAVSRSYKGDEDDDGGDGTARVGRGDVFLALLKGLYQETKRLGATHWVAATERSLQRLLARQGFPFRPIGPESDYFGLVAPYQLDIEEFDNVIRSRRFPALEEFHVGFDAPKETPLSEEDEQAAFAYAVTHSDHGSSNRQGSRGH